MLNRNNSAKTVLVVNGNVDALVLMTAVLHGKYRVLSAADAESALRLLAFAGANVDLAVVDQNVTTLKPGVLKRRMTEMVPRLRVLPMHSVIENGVIRLRALSMTNHRRSDSLLQCISMALAGHRPTGRGSVRRGRPLASRPFTRKVMVAGHNIG